MLIVFVAALTFVLCQLTVCGCMAWLGLRFYRRERAQIALDVTQALTDFATAPDKDTPSPLAILIDQAALLLAARLVQQVKAMLAGTESGLSKGAQAEMMTEATKGSPWLTLLSGILPARLRNQLLKNPQMIGALSSLGGNHHSDSTPSGAQKSFEL